MILANYSKTIDNKFIGNSLSNTSFEGKFVKVKNKMPFKIRYKSPFEEAKLGLISPTDLVKREVLDYSKYKLPCPCCGNFMIHPKLMERIKSEITEVPADTINLLNYFKPYMHNVERQVFDIIVNSNKKHPLLDFHEILQKKFPAAEKSLVIKQSSILSEISLLARDNLSEKSFCDLMKIIDQTYKKILTKNTIDKPSFGRKKFIDELEKFFKCSQNFSDTENFPKVKSAILNCAYRMPTSYNSVDAFIVKFSKPQYDHKHLAIRLLSSSEATVEHILPEYCGGKTKFSNMIVECAADNHKRHHDDLLKQIDENPQMLTFMKKHFDKLINLSKQRKVDRSYISEIAMTYYQLSKGLIDIDVSGLWKNAKNSKTKSTNYFPKEIKDVFTKAEKREEIKLNKYKKL